MHRIVEWDWREQPNWDSIVECMAEVFDGTHRPGLRLVPDTQSDHYALVVSSQPMTDEQAQEVFDDEGGHSEMAEGDRS